MVITPFNPLFSLFRVGDIIDRDRGSWNVNMFNEVSLPVDVDSIVKILLSWVFLAWISKWATNDEPGVSFYQAEKQLSKPK